MSDIYFVVWLLFILAIAGSLLYSFFKRKTDIKALRLVYITLFAALILFAIRLVASRIITIPDTIDDWFLYTLIIFIVFIVGELIYGGLTKKDKTPQQKKLFKVAVILFIIAFIAFLALLLLITT